MHGCLWQRARVLEHAGPLLWRPRASEHAFSGLSDDDLRQQIAYYTSNYQYCPVCTTDARRVKLFADAFEDWDGHEQTIALLHVALLSGSTLYAQPAAPAGLGQRLARIDTALRNRGRRRVAAR